MIRRIILALRMALAAGAGLQAVKAVARPKPKRGA